MSPSHERRSVRRSVTLVAALATMALILAACGAPPTAEGSGGGRIAAGDEKQLPPCPLDALAEATEPVEVNLWFSGIVDPPKKTMTDLVAAFNASQDEVEVTADYQGTAYAEGMRKYQNAAATPDQLPDMMLVEDTDLGELVDRGQILPAQSCMEADGFDVTQINAAVRGRYEVDDVLYPAFMNVSTPILYYNKAHFQKAGLDPNDPPGTMEEVEAAARKLQDAGVAPKPLSFLANDWFLSTWLTGASEEAVNNANGRSEPATEATFDTPKIQGLLTQLDRMNSDGLLNPFPVTDGKIDHYLALIQEQSSMLIETSTASGTIASALGGELDAAGSGFDLDPSQLATANLIPATGEFPGIDSPGKVYASGGAFYILNTSSPAQQAASWKFFRFLLQPENAIKWNLEGGYLPVLKETVDDPAVAQFQETELDGNLLQPGYEQLSALDPDQAGPLIGPYSAYEDALRGAMEGVLFSGADPVDALSQAQDEVTSALTNYNGS